MNGCADGDHLIGIDTLVRILAKEGAHAILHGGHTCHPANHDDLVDVTGVQPSIGQGLFKGSNRSVDQIRGQLLQLGTRQGQDQMLGATGIRCDIG